MRTLLLFLLPFLASAQDVIEINKNVTYQVKITGEDDEKYYYYMWDDATRTERTVNKRIVTDLVRDENQCRFEKNEVDEFTGETVVETRWVSFGSGKIYTAFDIWSASAGRVDDTYYIGLMLVSADLFTMSSDNKVMFKLHDGSVITAYNSNFTTPERMGYNTFTPNWQCKVYCYISKEDFTKMMGMAIEKTRVYLNQGYTDIDIKGKKALAISNSIKCVLQSEI